ncbi:MAG TPA: hypothetical protein VF926_05795, partial [Mycobacterium sp.]
MPAQPSISRGLPPANQLRSKRTSRAARATTGREATSAPPSERLFLEFHRGQTLRLDDNPVG